MGKIQTKNEMIMKPDWFLPGIYADGSDEEKIQYLLLSHKMKFDKAIADKDLSKMFEIVFHYLNLNSLFSDQRLYNERYYRIEAEPTMQIFINEIKNKKGTDSAMSILKYINDVYLDLLTRYLDLAIITFGKGKIVVKNQQIHDDNADIYTMINISSCDIYELWKMHYDADEILGNRIKKLDNITIPNNNTKKFSEYIETYNKKTRGGKISDKSIIGVELELAEDTTNIIYLIRDICMLNKLFYSGIKFELFVMHRILDTIKDRGVFPFKLTI